MAEESANKRVAKNAVALTLRMMLVTIVGLYTSRVILEALGVDNYGIYGVVGGVVGMASFLNVTMSGATSRFITFEMGKGYSQKLKDIFSTALIIHFCIALAVVVLAETVGLWFLNYKMVIPADRMFAANVVYQLSIASVVLTFTQVPYGADIIAHERMDIFAYFEIVNVSLKLLIAYLLFISPFDRLILYASLLFSVTLLNAIFYRWYCIRHFPEARFSTHFSKDCARQMLSFSAFDLYGNMCGIFKNQSQPVVLNLFFGVVANAGANIALTVMGTVSGLSSTVMQAFRPQIIKQYAVGDYTTMCRLMCRSIQFTLIVFAAIAIPVIIEAPRVLYLWLGQVPPYSAIFLRIVMIVSVVSAINSLNNVAIHATGNIKGISFINGSIFLLCPLTTYLLMKFAGAPAQTGYLVDVVLVGVIATVSIILIHLQIRQFAIWRYVRSIFRIIACIAVAAAVTFAANKLIFTSPAPVTEKMYSLGVLTVTSAVSVVACFAAAFAFGFDKADSAYMIEAVRDKYNRIFNKKQA